MNPGVILFVHFKQTAAAVTKTVEVRRTMLHRLLVRVCFPSEVSRNLDQWSVLSSMSLLLRAKPYSGMGSNARDLFFSLSTISFDALTIENSGRWSVQLRLLELSYSLPSSSFFVRCNDKDVTLAYFASL
ncbi:hypothetical protein MLD38_008397 [Melastoma candidum]|uniref:Uncharacterized protein n=1 Tax=Melastoma candidum TaxID=119954 RepID=A0ACB9RXW7_9MYRT|nr:hypothetical protein MLD38_008397 [Melastoma candidum]